jgi:hypothetical protein
MGLYAYICKPLKKGGLMDLISFRELEKKEVEDYFARAEEMDHQGRRSRS